MKYVGAIDQGTSSTRFMIFNESGDIVAVNQKEHKQYYPQPGWVEHDPMEIWSCTCDVISACLKSSPISASDLSAVGITNQRETTLVWNAETGEPYYNAIVWNDTRTAPIAKSMEGKYGPDRFRAKTGLPLASYFSATKLSWLIDNVKGLKEDLKSGKAKFGTIDSWLMYNLTGGVNGGIHITSVCNASRTLLMNLGTLKWDDEILKALDIPKECLPKIVSNSEVYANGAKGGYLDGVPLAGILGDQQAAMFGQTCYAAGEVKSTYGTGNFVLMNTGKSQCPSTNGLLTTIGYKLGDEEVVYALEGAVAYCGSVIQWLRDNLKIIQDAPQSQTFAEKVDDNGGMYFVPAFAGLFAPRWRADARGCFVGMTAYNTRDHVCRAALEAAAYQCKEVVDAMIKDSGVNLTAMKVDGGMTANTLLMQFQADILDCPVYRPVIPETTALGAAYAAGLAVGVWSGLDEIKKQWQCDEQWESKMETSVREKYWMEWNRAVSKSLGWVDGGDGSEPKKGGGWGKVVAFAAVAAGLGFIMGQKKR
ncbi:hypothetical protein TrVE_jg13258 [Triparma verrucosa]|uniref:glycerol kinase n=2 Tax=Triparma TaxID=722752 RepID=A0A9W7DXH9_9STRA|nr:hypothetical protein TrST_g2354 [Triparma strigata]GMH88177.1 hypothetical protein TrVE_jg13258 [Triparma verrucosa]